MTAHIFIEFVSDPQHILRCLEIFHEKLFLSLLNLALAGSLVRATVHVYLYVNAIFTVAAVQQRASFYFVIYLSDKIYAETNI